MRLTDTFSPCKPKITDSFAPPNSLRVRLNWISIWGANDLDLRLAFGQKCNACTPGNEDCPVGHACTTEAFKTRCRSIEPPAMPEIPGVELRPNIKRQPLGASCLLSQHCDTNLVCGVAPGTLGICSIPCSAGTNCPPDHHCLSPENEISFCTATCAARDAPISGSDKVCLPTETGRVAVPEQGSEETPPPQ